MAAPQRDALPEARAIISALVRLRDDAGLRCEALSNPTAVLDALALTGVARCSLAAALSTSSRAAGTTDAPAAFIFW